MSEPFDPVSVENAIRECSQRIAKGVLVVSRALDEWKATDRAYDAAEDRAYFHAEGSVEDRKRRARLECETERAARDVAEVAYKRAAGTARALEHELSGLQSISAGMRTVYGVAGRVEQ